MLFTFLGIDPGSSPVLAASAGAGSAVEHWTESRGMQNLPDRLRQMFGAGGPTAIGFEQPPYYMDGDAIQTATKFAEATGVMKGVLTALGWADRTQVFTPLEWMTRVVPDHSWPTGQRSYAARKKFFDARAADHFGPRLRHKVKRSQGDALCILSIIERETA